MILETTPSIAAYLAEQATKWLKALSLGESVAVTFVPKTDRSVRLQQVLGNKRLLAHVLGRTTHYFFHILTPDVYESETEEDLQQYLAESLNTADLNTSRHSFDDWMAHFQKQKTRLVLVSAEAERLLEPPHAVVLSFLTSILEQYYPLIRVLGLYETDITNPSVALLLPSSPTLYENVFRYPLYNEKHTLDFIKLLSTLWSVTLPKRTVDEIISGCGGHLWLVRGVVREILTKGTWSAKDERMMFRLQLVFSKFLSSEQHVLEKVIVRQRNFSAEERHSLGYLKKMRILTVQEQCAVGVLRDFLRERAGLGQPLTMQNNHILLSGLPVDSFFSRKEHRVLRALLEQPGKVVVRDELARRIWPINTDEHFSDWAIDQIITRLRKRLLKLSLSSQMVEVVRGRGYRLNV